MKPTGFVKKIDEMGRIVIPKSVRQALSIETGDNLQFFIDGDGIVMKRFSTSCVFCGSGDDLSELMGKYVCKSCLSSLKQD